MFRKGFLYKQFTLKQLETDVSAVRPGIEEVQAFAAVLNQTRSSTIGGDDDSGDDI